MGQRGLVGNSYMNWIQPNCSLGRFSSYMNTKVTVQTSDCSELRGTIADTISVTDEETHINYHQQIKQSWI